MPGLTPDQVLEVSQAILNFEARRDVNGHLKVYNLPASDGGGSYEVAGINERYDHDNAAQLRALLAAGEYDEAEKEALAYYGENTAGVAAWGCPAAIEAYLRDTAFNRGLTGAAMILQHALNVSVDGHVGPVTRIALANATIDQAALLNRLRSAREWYERVHVGVRMIFWHGLVNRWDKALKMAWKYLPPPPPSPEIPIGVKDS